MQSEATNVDNLLERYRESLLKANKTLNLISRRDVNNLSRDLIDESLLPVSQSNIKLASPLLDIGTGGGLPGIPLKIARPKLSVTLLEANRNKTLFLKRTVRELDLTDIEVVWSRAESFIAENSNKGRFRTIVSRGVGRMNDLLLWCNHLLAADGELIIWQYSLSEIDAPQGVSFMKPEYYIMSNRVTLAVLRKLPDQNNN